MIGRCRLALDFSLPVFRKTRTPPTTLSQILATMLAAEPTSSAVQKTWTPDPAVPPPEPSMNFNAEGKPFVKPCCACPNTKKERDDCVIQLGPEDVRCADLITAHKQCMQSFGFKV